MESFFNSQTKFLDVHGGYYTATIYIHYIFFPSFRFNLIIEKLFFIA
jgi:hypothetical protein